ncbi:MAG: two-component regulator propeller domain-containing protein [Terracidiphilus sp.]|jgi:ligand-binding sensor domain-containing protein/signal transduction histidine kinase
MTALLVLAASCLQAQAGAGGTVSTSNEFNFTAHSWQSQNGLPGETVQAFSQTPDGYLWVGTTEGLVRFDGAHFRLFAHENTPALHENSVFCLLTGRDGRLWIGTDGGGLVEMHDGVFRAYTAADGLTDGFVRALFEDRSGTVWVATDSGLFRVTNGNVDRVDNRPEMPANAFHGVFQDHLGRVWAGAGRLFAILNGHPKEYALEGTDSQHRVKSILETEDGSIWVGTVSGLYRLRSSSTRFERVAGVWGTVRTLCEVSGGELWAGTIGQGIFRIRFLTPASKVVRLTSPSPLMSNTVLSIFADDSRNLWIGTQVGMVRLSRTPVHVLSLPEAADSDFGTVSLDADGSLWAASNELVHIEGNRAVPTRFPGVGDAHVRNVLRARDGALWIGTDGSGVYRVSAKGTVHYTTRQGLVNNFVRALLEARDGSLWIETDSGVSHLENGGFHNLTMDNGLVHFSTRSILEDRNGDIWIGTEHGLNHLRNEQVIHDSVTNALKDEKVWAIHQDPEGGLWFGTRSDGLYRFREGRLTHYTTANGLASNSILCILEDGRRHFWLSSPLGVMLLNRDELDAQADGQQQRLSLRFYRADTGERSTLFYGGTQPSGTITRSGEVWFPTDGGLWRIRPTEYAPSVLSHLDFGSISVDGKNVPLTFPLQLTAGASRVEIEYEPVMLRSQEDLEFRYRMEGFDEDWTFADTQRRSATYTNLPAGKYTFAVQAWEMDHPEHVLEARVSLVKQPYFYRTPWFMALCALALGLISVLAYQLRMRQVHGRYEAVLAERSRLAREMHDTLIQGCAGVSAMLEAASSCERDDDESRLHLIDYANTQIRATMDEARQAVWNLRAGEQVPTDLCTSLAQMAGRMSREYDVHVDCRSIGNAFPIGQQETHELMMVAREAFFNAVLHGHPKEIGAELRFSADALEMLLTDDGEGFDPKAKPEDGHYGLQGMRERIHRFGGQLTIESQTHQGTQIQVTIPRAGLSHEPGDAKGIQATHG